jgi:hypothetical protein
MRKRTNKTDTWLTPRDFYQKIDMRFCFEDFDPCPPDCDLSKFNGLHVPWRRRTFFNPPWNAQDKPKFIHKAYQESLLGKFVVGLLPVSTSTLVFHEVILPFAKIEYLRGRLPFEGIDSEGNWVNPHTGMYSLPNVPEGAPQIYRNGQVDLMLCLFGDENI